jgi:hypothetical protein
LENSSTLFKMTKTVTHINCPEEWQSTNDWDSHRPLLWLALSNTKDTVVEFGSGMGSTPLIAKYCFSPTKDSHITFLSFETNKKWVGKSGSRYLEGSYLSINPTQKGLLFIDSAPGEERKYLIAKHAFCTDVIVVHDTEQGAEYVYGMSEILSTFKYRVDYRPGGKPHTTSVSNTIDITKWINQS